MCAVAALGLTLLAGTADAASVGRGQPDGGFWDPEPIVFRASPGETLDLEIAPAADGQALLTDHNGTPITPGPGCAQSPAGVICDVGDTWQIYVYLADGHDRVVSDADLGFYTTVLGAGGDDRLESNGSSNLDGGPGDDEFTAAAGACCGAATADYSSRDAGVTLALADGQATHANGSAGESDTFGDGIENLRGSRGADVIQGDSERNYLEGAGGDDVIRGAGGDDVIWSWSGRVTLSGGDGSDYMAADFAPRDVSGGTGDDLLQLNGWTDMNQLVTLDGVGNDGPLAPGARVDWYPGVIGAGDLAAWVPLKGNVHADVEDVTAGYGNDVVVGNDAANRLTGWPGDDILVGGGGADTLDGNEGADTLWARDGEPDQVSCGDGEDRVIADAADTVDADCETVMTGVALPLPPAPLAQAPAGLPIPDPVSGWNPRYGPTGFGPWGFWPPPQYAQWPGGRPIATPPPRTARSPHEVHRPIAIQASALRIRPGGTVTVSGKAKPLQPVVLEQDTRLSGIFRVIRRGRTGLRGRYSFKGLRPRRSTRYLVRIGIQTSPTVKVKVKGRPLRR